MPPKRGRPEPEILASVVPLARDAFAPRLLTYPAFVGMGMMVRRCVLTRDASPATCLSPAAPRRAGDGRRRDGDRFRVCCHDCVTWTCWCVARCAGVLGRRGQVV
jgi:hypothetical protein